MGFPLVLTLNDVEQRSNLLSPITPVLLHGSVARNVAMFESRKGIFDSDQFNGVAAIFVM